MNQAAWAGIIITLVLAVVSPILVWWGASRTFAGYFDAWKEASSQWRVATDAKLVEMQRNITDISYPNLNARLARVETITEDLPIVREQIKNLREDILNIRDWKHTKADPYINALDRLKDEVDRIGKRGS